MSCDCFDVSVAKSVIKPFDDRDTVPDTTRCGGLMGEICAVQHVFRYRAAAPKPFRRLKLAFPACRAAEVGMGKGVGHA